MNKLIKANLNDLFFLERISKASKKQNMAFVNDDNLDAVNLHLVHAILGE
ncbi:hypothetical protein OAC56_00220 [Flavobacteriaceae bacterium]|nr:hypothetical protein [Flavobacteriaceae bacterium]MDB9964889.1 hypothetical protein [Flavobacteriaceae bacterium]